MSVRRPVRSPRSVALAALGIAGAVLSACATAPTPAPYTPPPSSAFSAEDFSWSAAPGSASIHGRIEFRRDDTAYACTGSIGLTPVTPYTRARFLTLYGSADRAAVPVDVVRARTVPDPGADYRAFVRSEACVDGRFEFTGLPDGGWFIIAPVGAGDERLVLMRRVETRGGRPVTVVM